MHRARVRFVTAFSIVLSLLLIVTVSARQGSRAGAPPSDRAGWTIPATAEGETSPLVVNDGVLAAGRKLFLSKCRRCHGPDGKGDGPDADKKQKHMNLTLAARAAANPDGVVFHKIWNGRSSPKMPRFSEEYSRDQVWAIVAYVQSLRAK